MTVFEVLRALWRSPGDLLLRRWNWKSAVFSSTMRAAIFFFCNLKAGWSAATGAMLAEFAYRSITAGFYGALTQSFRRVTPGWAANLTVMILLPLASHSIELMVHLLRHTPKLKTSIITSVCFTALSTLFNLYAMRRGALIVGEESQSAAADMRRMPRLIAGFVACGPVALWRLAMRPFSPARAAAGSALIALILSTCLPLSGGTTLQGGKHLRRVYRATVYVTLLSVPIYNRTGVGGGFASLDETNRNGSREVRLRFLSGSIPERAAGLNRLGYVEEAQVERPSGLSDIHYFGFITANQEESLGQAKDALNAPGKDNTRFEAAEGVLNAHLSAYSVRLLDLPSQFRWNQGSELLRDALYRFAAAPVKRTARSEPTDAESSCTTFLFALMQAVTSSNAKSQIHFIHDGNRFQLTTEKTEDGKAGQELAKEGLAAAKDVVRLKGTIHGETTHEQSTFRLWYDRTSSNPLPLRFELHPRSYLRLVFDAVQDEASNSEGQNLALTLPTVDIRTTFTQ